MEGYLGQIAERKNSFMPGAGKDSLAQPAANPNVQTNDPFENDILQSAPDTGIRSQQGAQEIFTARASEKNTADHLPAPSTVIPPKFDIPYLSRHISRRPEQKQDLQNNQGISRNTTPVTGKNTLMQEQKEPYKTDSFLLKNHLHKTELIKTDPFILKKPTAKTELIRETITDIQHYPKQEKDHVQEAKPVNNILMPAQLKPAYAEKQMPVAKSTTAPKLVIEKINIEIMPPAKPQQVTNRIEKRIITESRPADNRAKGKFIFGLGQF